MNTAIAAGHEETLSAAQEVLKAGGNAFDAAIAALVASFVTEPCMSSAGGGAFAQVLTAAGDAWVYDGFCQTPKNKNLHQDIDFQPVTVDFGGTQEVFHLGKASTAVPGSIALVFSMHEQLGTMPVSELFQPAIALAKTGVKVNEFQYEDWVLLEQILRIDPKVKDLFFKEDRLLRVGEKIYMPGFADFLDFLGKEGRGAFYEGEIAQKIVKDYQEGGGFLHMEDFRDYQIIRRQPLSFSFAQKQILTNPLPSIGGSTLAIACALLEQFPPPNDWKDIKHLQQLHQLLERLDQRPKQKEALVLELKKLSQKIPPKPPKNGLPKKWGSTSHFNILDRWGNAVSLSTTNGEGCGYFIEGTDIQLNNMLGESALLPDGFHSWPTNSRLSSMMSPTMVLDDNKKVEMILGSGGASRIPGAIFQVLLYLLHYDMDLHQAVNAPRLHLEHNCFNQETGFPLRLNANSIKQEYSCWDKSSLYFGGVHSIARKDGYFMAAGDDRRDGVAYSGI